MVLLETFKLYQKLTGKIKAYKFYNPSYKLESVLLMK